MMRAPSIRAGMALQERLSIAHQVDPTAPEAAMPAYMESFLAHLRLLIGVPFDYLVPDPRLLPDESIRFFYLDRSWTDRLVDGAIAVGKIGTREQAHHQAHAQNLQSQLDQTERAVRPRQRGVPPDPPNQAAGIVTGFLLRSAAVSGWPSMDVRAFSNALPANVDLAEAEKYRIHTLRLELLSPSVLFALFDGVPKLVWCEEPHHGVQFGMTFAGGTYKLDRHTKSGALETGAPMVPVPTRAAHPRVVAAQALRKKLIGLNDPNMVPQTGSAAFAIELLDLPWRQRFQGTAKSGGTHPAYTVTSQQVRLQLDVALGGIL